MQKRLVQAYNMQQKNKAVLVDVREAKYYNKGHASGCLNVGLFRSVEGRTPLDNLKRLAMAGFAMEATGEGQGQTPRKSTQASHCVLSLRHVPNDICSMVLMGCYLNNTSSSHDRLLSLLQNGIQTSAKMHWQPCRRTRQLLSCVRWEVQCLSGPSLVR